MSTCIRTGALLATFGGGQTTGSGTTTGAPVGTDRGSEGVVAGRSEGVVEAGYGGDRSAICYDPRARGAPHRARIGEHGSTNGLQHGVGIVLGGGGALAV